MSKLMDFLNTLTQDELREAYREMEVLSDPLSRELIIRITRD